MAWSLLVLGVAAASYAWVVSLPLTGIDAIPTIAAAHVEHARELPSVLTRELRGGAQPGGSYYRPLTLLTYGVESLAWEWNSRGHHATDLACHALAALAIFWMCRLAFAQGLMTALAVVAIFLIHPVVNEVVPAVSRRQEPLLVIAFAVTLIGACRLPAARGWALLLLGSVAAVCSVERGLVIPGIVFAYLLLHRPGPESPGSRLRLALLWTAPVLAVALGFYALRAALFGTGGVFFEPARAARISSRYFLQLVHPQQLIDLHMPTSMLAAAPWLAAALVGATVTGWIFWCSERKGTLLFALAWISGYGLLFAVAGQGNSWYPYTAVPALALLLVTVGTEGWRAIASGGAARLRGVLTLLLVTGILMPLVVTSPALFRYPAWEIAGSLSDRFLSELRRVARELPGDTTPVVINLPGHYRESDSQLRVTRSAAILWPRSIEIWRDVNEIDREIVILGAADFVGEVSMPVIDLDAGGPGADDLRANDPQADTRISIAFHRGASVYKAPDRIGTTIAPLPEGQGRGFTFPLKAPAQGHRHTVFVFDGERLLPY